MCLCSLCGYFLDSLQPFANEIVNRVNVDLILPMMVQEGLVTPEQQQFLSSLYHTAWQKQQMLCSIVIVMSEDCVEKFRNCLLQTSDYEPHKELHDKLCTS